MSDVNAFEESDRAVRARLEDEFAEQIARGLQLASEVERLEAEVEGQTDRADALEELARITREKLEQAEAEVERLRDKYDECWADWNAATNEVKRLKKKADWLVGALRAEEAVSRDRGAEVERLRAELRGARLVFPEYDTLKDEVERLRANLQTTVENRDAWLAAVEQLRAALKPAMEWAAGYPLGGDMDERAAADVYERARNALSTST